MGSNDTLPMCFRRILLNRIDYLYLGNILIKNQTIFRPKKEQKYFTSILALPKMLCRSLLLALLLRKRNG